MTTLPVYSYRIMGHRGARLLHTENSIEGIKKAFAQKSDIIEIDVRMTRDGQFVIFHDPYLGRMTGRRGRVSQKSLEEIRLSTLPSGGRIPTLQEVLGLFSEFQKENPDIFFLLDLKESLISPFDEDAFFRIYETFGDNVKNTILASFSYPLLKRIQRREGRQTLAMYSIIPRKRTIMRANELGAVFVGSRYLTAGFIEEAHRHHLNVISWNQADNAHLEWLLKNKVSVIGTGRPAAVRKKIERIFGEA